MGQAMTFSQRFKACEVLKENKDKFIAARPTQRQASTMLANLCGFHVPESSVPLIKSTAEVEWKSPRSAPKPDTKFSSVRAIRTLARAVRQLSEKLGEPVSPFVVALCESSPKPATAASSAAPSREASAAPGAA